MRLRNPWGVFTWNGDYCDTSSKWTPQLKEAVQFEVTPGAFWMTFEDFRSFFHEITICLLGAMDGWRTREQLHGVYGKQHVYAKKNCLLHVF